MSSPLSKLPPRFQAPVRAALQALTAPADLSDEAVMRPKWRPFGLIRKTRPFDCSEPRMR